jgi:hypothetical protein
MDMAFPLSEAQAHLNELVAQDLADIALCETIKARNETGLPHEQFMASLDQVI